jgi:hypothetical protein
MSVVLSLLTVEMSERTRDACVRPHVWLLEIGAFLFSSPAGRFNSWPQCDGIADGVAHAIRRCRPDQISEMRPHEGGLHGS